jgi:acid phosphatase
MRRRLFALFALILVFALNYPLRALPQLAAPSVVNVAANPGRSNSVITWTTSPAADSQVEYGLTTSYTNVSPLDATLVLSHAVTLVGLQSSTTYHFRVRSRDSAGNLTVSPDGTFSTLGAASATGVKVAFIGDQNLGASATAVLQLIKNEGAQAVVHLGDFDFNDNPAAWDQQINSVLGPSFPYFAVIGFHDVTSLAGYQQKLQARLNQISGASCSGNLAVQSVCIYKGLMMVFTAPGVTGTGHDIYIRDQLAQSNFAWRISGWNPVQQLMQVGEHLDEAGWAVYEESRNGGAIVATSHTRSYERTHLMSSFQNQTIASTANPLQISRGQSFAFVSGLGGDVVRPQLLNGPWWASIWTSDQGADYGALFCTFGVNDEPNRARCYFKDISNHIPDQFDILSGVNGGSPTPPSVSITSPASGATISGITTVTASASDAVGVAGVQFKVDGNNLGGEATTAPYSVSLDTATLVNGSHVLTAVARNVSGITTTSAAVNITVSNVSAPPPVISGVSVSGIATTAATITWITDVQASSQVNYGPTTAYGFSAPLDTTLVAGHSQTLSGLSPNTLYHYRVRSRGANGVESVSGDFTFTTASSSVQFGPIVIVVEENHSYSSVIGNTEMPYLNGLANQYGLATNYFADTHPSIGNYFMLTTGQVITNDSAFNGTVTEDNVVRRLLAAGKTWKAYAESLPSVGYTGDGPYPYARRHNPLSYFSDVINTTQVNNLVPFSQFATDLASNSLPRYSFVVPNLLDDAHDATLGQADQWLQTNIGPLLSNPTFQQNGLLVIVFDESFDTDTQFGGGQVATVVVGPKVKPGYRSTTFYQHESTLRMMAQGIGLTSFPGAAASAPDMGEFFLTGPAASSLSLTPASVVGGNPSQGTVTLTGAAPPGGAVVTLSSNNTAVATVPASMTVAAGAISGNFTITTLAVSASTTVTISTSYGGTTPTASLTVNPPPLVLSSLSLNPTSVIGGGTSQGTATLTSAASAGGAVVQLSSGNTTVATVPASASVAAGATSATFTVNTNPVSTSTVVTISGTYGGTTRTVSLTVSPGSPPPTMSAVTLANTSLTGGNTTQGTVALTGAAPSGGAVVTLSSSNTAAATVPVSVTVAAGATSATFTVSTAPVGSSANATISGTYGGASRTASLSVLPPVQSTSHIDFTYPDRTSLLAGGWDFLAKTQSGATRNTEVGSALPLNYDQTAHPGILRVPIGGPGDVWQLENASKNTLFRNLAPDWVSIRLRVAAFNPTANYQEVGLIAYQDDDNYVIINRFYDAGQIVVLAHEQAAAGTELSRVPLTNTGDLILRIDRNTLNNRYATSYSTDGGATWVALPGNVQRTLSNPRLAIEIDYDLTGTVPSADLAWVEVVRAPTQLAPILTASSPNSGRQGQTISVTLTGSNFTSGATCGFGPGITVNSCVLNSSTQLTANVTVLATATLGSRNVTVTNADGQTTNLAAGFSVTP